MQALGSIQSTPRGDAQGKWWQVTYDLPYAASLTFCTLSLKTLCAHASSVDSLLQVPEQIIY
jgi:hypothetical protein